MEPMSQRDPLEHEQRRARRPAGATERLRRSQTQRVMAGLAGGIAEFTGYPVRWVRTVFVLSIPLSLGITVGGYLAFWWLLPSEPG
jgi:phage shock protein PspC (stress-responsive transcriptional regulator)